MSLGIKPNWGLNPSSEGDRDIWVPGVETPGYAYLIIVNCQFSIYSLFSLSPALSTILL